MTTYSKKFPPDGHYVYAYVRKDGTPYYIGKGREGRAWSRSDRTVFPQADGSNIVIMESNLTDVGALAIERRMIAWYGRIDNATGILHNKTDGGDGNSGWVQPDWVKAKISLAKKGKSIWSPEDKAKMSESRSGNGHWAFGKVMSDTVKAKIAATAKATVHLRKTKLKTYILYDSITGESIEFNRATRDKIYADRNINAAGISWAVKYSNNSLYKGRWTILRQV